MTTVLCDLDGVVYRGSQAIDGAGAALEALAEAGIGVRFITNNSTRTPEATADKLTRLTGVAVHGDQVLTSAQAALRMMMGDGDSPVLIVGSDGVQVEVERAGLSSTSDPNEARSVVVGLTRELSYDLIADATAAIANGARFVATNTDATFPTEDGFAPGCGAIVAAIATATGQAPEVAGKPYQPMRDLIRSLVDDDVWVVGDRVDTDIAMASAEPGWKSILVLTGVTGTEEVAESGTDHVARDLRDAVDVVLAHREPS